MLRVSLYYDEEEVLVIREHIVFFVLRGEDGARGRASQYLTTEIQSVRADIPTIAPPPPPSPDHPTSRRFNK
jgi:hypothetical protein